LNFYFYRCSLVVRHPGEGRDPGTTALSEPPSVNKEERSNIKMKNHVCATVFLGPGLRRDDGRRRHCDDERRGDQGITN